MTSILLGKIWDTASKPEAAQLAGAFEAAWRESPAARPDPVEFLSGAPEERPAELLAILRMDMNLRWSEGERTTVDAYRERFPFISGELLAGLLYEEFCLREEAGLAPDPAFYRERYPEASRLLRMLFGIHELIGGPRSDPRLAGSDPPAFPEVGESIAGFELVDELGRGAFARVYLARESELADRPVALKASRSGAREPRTLARLQHTHIVPIFSHRVDAVASLHLICMPYLGRVTLASMLAAPAFAKASRGTDLAAILDALSPEDAPRFERRRGLEAIQAKSFERAVAWWFSKLAEALQHAHDRGVLHGDLKPSNVLVTGDGLPMLLDFNLARDPEVEGVAPETLGGTLEYMAPERLEHIAGRGAGGDHRSDIYALGIVLYEVLARGKRPFAFESGSKSLLSALDHAIAERKRGAPAPIRRAIDISPELAAVVEKCLEPDPRDRYQSAGDLALDLDAAAEDRALRHAREPLRSYLRRSLKWYRKPLTAAAVIAAVAVVAVSLLLRFQWERGMLKGEVRRRIEAARESIADGDPAAAEEKIKSAAVLIDRKLGFADARAQIADLSGRIRFEADIADRALKIKRDGQKVRFLLLGFGGDPETAEQEVERLLARLDIPSRTDWRRTLDRSSLPEPAKRRLIEDVNELLFLWAVMLERTSGDDRASAEQGVRICDFALATVEPAGPWRALRARLASSNGREAAGLRDDPERETSAVACFEWAVLRWLERRRREAVAFLERAVRLEPSDYWAEFYLGYALNSTGDFQEALLHYGIAVSIEKNSPWARFNRARILRAQGEWEKALADLNPALESAERLGFDYSDAKLDRGLARQMLGDSAGARADYDAVIRSANPRNARGARLNRALLDLDEGRVREAFSAFRLLLQEDPSDVTVRQAYVKYAIKAGDYRSAEFELGRLIASKKPPNPDWLAGRAVTRLALGKPRQALEDALAALAADPRTRLDRRYLAERCRIAIGDWRGLAGFDRPEDIVRFPVAGESLNRDLRLCLDHMRIRPRDGRGAAEFHRVRAVLLACLGDREAIAEAKLAVDGEGGSPASLVLLARISRRLGERKPALAAVNRALAADPNSPVALELRGVLKTEAGDHRGGAADLELAANSGALATIHAALAENQFALGEYARSAEEWTRAIEVNPEDPWAYLGRARTSIALGRWSRATADLDQAINWAGENPTLLVKAAFAYLRCIPSRPRRVNRVLPLVLRVCALLRGSNPQGGGRGDR